jgi:hypothetical protein
LLGKTGCSSNIWCISPFPWNTKSCKLCIQK